MPAPSAVSAPGRGRGKTDLMKPDRYCELAAGCRSIRPVAGNNRYEKVSRMMRKNLLFFLGAAAGACLTLVVTGPQGAQWVAVAKAAAGADAYSQLNLFGEVFERVRTEYVEKPDDGKLIEGAINGMVTALDPHSRYMNQSAWQDMQETTHGEFGGPGPGGRIGDGILQEGAPLDD